VKPTANEAPWFRAAVLGAVLISVALRVIWLQRLPGVNADEAWYGLSALTLLDGDPQWLTPNQRLGNPFFIVLAAAVHTLMEPSVLALRVPAVLSGLVLILGSGCLARALYPRVAMVAFAFVVLIACSPVDVGYARLGWGASQSVLFALPPLYFALRGHTPLALLAVGAACLVHPFNAFLAIVVAPVLLPTLWERLRAGSAAYRLTALAACGLLMLLLFLGRDFLEGALAHWMSVIPGRLTSPERWLRFATNVLQLTSGTTVSEYLVGARRYATASDLLMLGLIFAVVAGSVRAKWSRPERRLLVGLAFSLVAFYLLAGNGAIEAGLERYALFLVAPIYLLIAIAIGKLAEVQPARARALILALGGVLLFASGWGQLSALHETEGQHAALTLKTGAREPKWAAYAALRGEIAPSAERPLLIVAQDYWLYWPLAYLAHSDPAIVVERMRERSGQPHSGPIAAVVYAGTAAQESLDRAEGWTELAASPIAGGGRSALYRLYLRASPLP
jgi:hypothetical protein